MVTSLNSFNCSVTGLVALHCISTPAVVYVLPGSVPIQTVRCPYERLKFVCLIENFSWLPLTPLKFVCLAALVRALCPGALRAGLLRAAWRTVLCAWCWRKAGAFLPHSSFVFSKTKLQKLCVGRWGPVSL